MKRVILKVDFSFMSRCTYIEIDMICNEYIISFLDSWCIHGLFTQAYLERKITRITGYE